MVVVVVLDLVTVLFLPVVDGGSNGVFRQDRAVNFDRRQRQLFDDLLSVHQRTMATRRVLLGDGELLLVDLRPLLHAGGDGQLLLVDGPLLLADAPLLLADGPLPLMASFATWSGSGAIMVGLPAL